MEKHVPPVRVAHDFLGRWTNSPAGIKSSMMIFLSYFLSRPALVLALAFSSFTVARAVSPFTLHSLRCEYRVDPLGIGTAQPRLSWEIVAPAAMRGATQGAYRILVASTPEILADDKGDLWDSGKIASNQTAQIVYAGAALASRQACFWKAQMWDGHDEPSAWSKPAKWSEGLNAKSDWQAQWIGFDAPGDSTITPEVRNRVMQQKWISGPWPADKKNPQTAFFLHGFDVPAGTTVKKAVFHLTADQECRIELNGHAVGDACHWEMAREIDAISALQPGHNAIRLSVTQEDGYPPAVLGELVLETDAAPIIIPVDNTWQVTNDDSADHPVKMEQAVNSDGHACVNFTQLPPAAYLRTEFSVGKPVKRATLYATALGVYEFHLNGQKVGRDVLTPGWSDFSRRARFQTYDVTALLHRGPNAAGALLGTGWFGSVTGFSRDQNVYGALPRLLAQLEIEFEDGTKQIIATGPDWKGADGPLRHADIWEGSAYDSRRDLPGWDRPDAAGTWAPVATGLTRLPNANPDFAVDLATLKIEAENAEPCRALETLAAKSVAEPQPHRYVFDLGQNMVGWARMQVTGRAGQKIKLRHGEMLNPNGTLYTTNLRSALATDVFYLKGGAQTLEPQFTYHGFRYVEVLGLDQAPDKSALSGIVVHSDITPTGSFTCSNDEVNQLVQNIIWSQRGNYLSIPTDCPQRDERLGWTGDAQFFIPTAIYNYDVAGFFNDWLTTLAEDSQAPDGTFAWVAPRAPGAIGDGATGWSDATIICTYNIYRVYGDTRIIADHWAPLERYMAWLAGKTDADGISHVGGFGDWLNKGSSASPDVMDTAYHAYIAGLMAEMARALGKSDDEKRYAALHDRIRDAFIRHFVQPDGGIKDSAQTGFALAFTMGLLPDEMRQKSTQQFIADLEKTGWHNGTGFIGTPRLLDALHDAGRDDAAYRILLQTTYPSWLFQVGLGATTMWERWDGWTPGEGFQDIGMNSFNHYAFGSVGHYLYSKVAGIDTDGPGFRNIVIAPRPEDGLTWAQADYHSINGPIHSAWKREGAGLTLTIDVPPNVTAQVRVPLAANQKVTESGRDAAHAPGVSFLKNDDGGICYQVGSGHYIFEAK
jgi:alpha-L-rhamnosidase